MIKRRVFIYVKDQVNWIALKVNEKGEMVDIYDSTEEDMSFFDWLGKVNSFQFITFCRDDYKRWIKEMEKVYTKQKKEFFVLKSKSVYMEDFLYMNYRIPKEMPMDLLLFLLGFSYPKTIQNKKQMVHLYYNLYMFFISQDEQTKKIKREGFLSYVIERWEKRKIEEKISFMCQSYTPFLLEQEDSFFVWNKTIKEKDFVALTNKWILFYLEKQYPTLFKHPPKWDPVLPINKSKVVEEDVFARLSNDKDKKRG